MVIIFEIYTPFTEFVMVSKYFKCSHSTVVPSTSVNCVLFANHFCLQYISMYKTKYDGSRPPEKFITAISEGNGRMVGDMLS